MPPYAPRRLASTGRCLVPLRRGRGLFSFRHVLLCRLTYRYASTSTTTISSTGSQNEAQNLSPLQRARSVLSSASRIRGVTASRSLSVLDPLIEACAEASTPKRHIGLLVYSEEEGIARNLVDYLLDDILSSDPSLRSALHDRWSAGKKSLRLQQKESETLDEDTVLITSPFFSRFPHPIVLEELHPSLSSEALSHLLKADIPIFVASPVYGPSPSLLYAISQNPRALCVIDSALDATSPSADRLRFQIADKYRCEANQVLLIDTARAHRGATTLSANPSSSTAVRTFQEDVLASGIPTLLRVLTEIVSSGPDKLHAETADTLTKRVITAVADILHHAKEEVRDVRGRSSTLHEEALEARERAEVEILGSGADIVVQGEKGRVARGVERVTADLRPVLDGLTWYRVPFVVDDVSIKVDGAVEHSFAKEFENELIFHTGRLSYLQSYFVSRTNSVLSSLLPAFKSSILQNTIAQMTSSPSFPITPTSPLYSSSSLLLPTSPTPHPALSTPVRARTAQLAHVTRSLHLTAQRLLLFTFTSTTLSTVSSALLYVHFSIDAPTSIGFGLLFSLIGLRVAVGRWTKAKGKWWSAFAKVGNGLGRDLSSVVGAVLDRQVCGVPNELCKGLQMIAEKREQEIGKVEDQLEELRATFRSGGIVKEGSNSEK